MRRKRSGRLTLVAGRHEWQNERSRPNRGVRMPPTLANGKVCYIEIPAVEIHRSADFYAKVFGWRIRQRGDGRTAFDDPTGEVSGSSVVGRKASSEPGLLFYIMVDSVAQA